LKPRYGREEVERIKKEVEMFENLDGVEYVRGCIGLNNLKGTEYANVVLMGLAHIEEVYEHFLMKDYEGGILGVFGKLVKRIWNKENFKGVVSPH
jgi:U4/U6.U5 tri-snRNP-associated protein 2